MDCQLDQSVNKAHDDALASREALYHRAEALLQRGDAEAALKDLRSALQLRKQPNGGDAKLHYAAGIAHLQNNDPNDAVRAFTNTIKAESMRLDGATSAVAADAYVQRALAFGDLNRHTHAVRDLNAAIELRPADGRLFLYRGMAFSARAGERDQEHALSDFTTAIALSPAGADAARRTQMSVDISSFATGTQGSVDNDMRQTSCSDADDIAAAYEALCARATHFRDVRRDYSAAVQDYSTAIRLQPELHFAYCGRARARILAGGEALSEYKSHGALWTAALKDLNRAATIAPSNAEPPFYLAHIFGELEQLALEIDTSVAGILTEWGLSACEAQSSNELLQKVETLGGFKNTCT